jgi:hypothetical protein
MAQLKQINEKAAKIENHCDSEWARIPQTGKTLEGLYRSQLFALVKSGKVKTAAIKQPGQTRTGVRLIHVPSLRAYIHSHVESEGPSK